ncbi:lachesin-like [Prorops nasuta]|uniref:lachesin-like n=1 Tax=Prorops nasuta TaxID=863751 RepID=UPI0034CE7FFE
MTSRLLENAGTAPLLSVLLVVTMVVAIDAVGHSNTRGYYSSFHQESLATAAGPVFVAPVGNQTAAIGREAIFSCSAQNIGKYKVGWLRASDQTILSIHTRTVTQNQRITVSYESGGSSGSVGVTGSSQAAEEVVNGTWRLHIRQLKESDRDCYMCQINTSPMLSVLGCLDILVPPDIVSGSDTSADLAVAEGDNVTLSCNATGRPTPRVSWRREDNQRILVRSSSTGGNIFDKYDMYNGSQLHFHRVERRQMGAYLCIASNDVPPAVSKRVTLAVNFAPAVKAPSQLLGTPLGKDVQLKCYVEAFPKTINYWMKMKQPEEEMLLEGPKYSVHEEINGYKVVMSLTVKSFTQEDSGSYRCVSTNSLGKADGLLRLYEIKLNAYDRSSRRNDHVSIIGGLAEAAQSSGSSGSILKINICNSRFWNFVSMFLFIPVLWPR